MKPGHERKRVLLVEDEALIALAEAMEMAFNLFESHQALQQENERHLRTKASLDEKNAFLESTFAAIQDGITVLGPDLIVEHVNPTMERWYGNGEPLRGKKCYQAYHGSGIKWLELFAFPMTNSSTGRVERVVE